MGAVYNKDGFDLINNHTFGMHRLVYWSPADL
jgi:hypothetical protein